MSAHFPLSCYLQTVIIYTYLDYYFQLLKTIITQHPRVLLKIYRHIFALQDVIVFTKNQQGCFIEDLSFFFYRFRFIYFLIYKYNLFLF